MAPRRDGGLRCTQDRGVESFVDGSDEGALLGELCGIDAGAQEADEDEGARVQLHGAHDEVRMAGGDALTVLLGEHAQRLLASAVALEVGEVGGLHLPILQQGDAPTIAGLSVTVNGQGLSSYNDSALPLYFDQYVLIPALRGAGPVAPAKINPWACAKLGMCQPLRDPSVGTIATVLLTAASALVGPEFGLASDAISSGTTVYRVFGGESQDVGQSWTTVDPFSVEDYRGAAGLFPGNSGEYVVEGTLTDTTGVTLRLALPGPGGVGGGLPEVLIQNAADQVCFVCVYIPKPAF